jgi:D-alanyl-D-alanine dipeptidase
MNAKRLFVFVCFGLLVVSCDESSELMEIKSKADVETVPDPQIMKDSIAKVKLDSATVAYMKTFNLVNILDVDPTIQVDLRYATDNNFMGHVLYDTLDALFLQEDVAVRVAACQSYLKEKHPNYSLLIYDGVRPLEVQREMWNALDSIPAGQRGKFVSNPSYGSVHNFGAAVDLTICDENGIPLDMGAGYDDFRDIAFPSKEWKFLASGELTKEQHENRKLLREVMKSQGFRGIPSEWWHFNACSRDQAVVKYKKLVFESGASSDY